MKIRKLQLKNIGVFDDETIEFQPCPEDKAEIHIFTGQNGSGKSTLLMGLASGFYGWKEEWDEDFEEKEEKDLPKNLPVNTERSLFKRFRFFEEDADSEVGFKSYISVSIDEYFETDKINYPELFEDYDWKAEITNGVDVFGISKEFFGIDEIRSTTWSSRVGFYKNAVSSEEIPKIDYAVFAYSGYRFVKSEKVELLKEFNDNPLTGSLDFVKTYEKFTINQWLANNLSTRALAREENNDSNANKFDENVKNLAKIISEVVGYGIDFKLKYSPPQLVLITQQKELDFDVLPDGLRSLLSWVGDLLMRVESLKWEDDLPLFEKNLVLLLDEIEVHLHPAWQRKVLPVVQKLFKNSQIFVSTHSPFVVNSVDDAWVYELKLEDGKAKVAVTSLTKTAYSYQTVLREVFDIDERFGEGTEEKGTQPQLKEFYKQRDAILKSNGKGRISKKKFLEFAENLASQSAELQSLVFLELARISKEKGEPYEI